MLQTEAFSGPAPVFQEWCDVCVVSICWKVDEIHVLFLYNHLRKSLIKLPDDVRKLDPSTNFYFR